MLMTARFAYIGLLCLGCACVGGQGSGSPPGSRREPTVATTYTLRLVGEHPPDWYYTTGTDCTVPTSSRYEIGDGRWLERDRHPLPHRRCSIEVDSTAWRTTSVDSGYYRVHGDTLHFFVDDREIGDHGWVAWALLRGDTLRFPAGEYDPGDFVYVKASRPPARRSGRGQRLP